MKKRSGNKLQNKKEERGNFQIELLEKQLLRALADYDNLRKRTEDEKSLWIKFSNQRILTSLIPVLDNFESAQKHLNDSGLAIAIGEFKKIFAEEGIGEINPKVDDVFRHDLHEAVDSVETEDKNKVGKIAEVILPGWKYQSEGDLSKDRLIIRHAKVKVYKI